MKKTITLLTALSLALILTSCASWKTSTTDPGQAYEKYSEAQLFTMAEKSLANRSYGRAVKYYEALSELYPFGAHAQQGQLDVIYAYYQTKDYASAEAAADSYIHLYPQSTNVDYAYYMKGLSEMYQSRTFLQQVIPIDMSDRDLTNMQQAYYTFSDLVQLIPTSPYAPYARQQMIYLRNLFAQHELNVATYYFKLKAYVAASNRASYLIRHYQGAPQVPQALVLLVQANRALGATDAANDAYQTLVQNYPNYPGVKQLAQ